MAEVRIGPVCGLLFWSVSSKTMLQMARGQCSWAGVHGFPPEIFSRENGQQWDKNVSVCLFILLVVSVLSVLWCWDETAVIFKICISSQMLWPPWTVQKVKQKSAFVFYIWSWPFFLLEIFGVLQREPGTLLTKRLSGVPGVNILVEYLQKYIGWQKIIFYGHSLS